MQKYTEKNHPKPRGDFLKVQMPVVHVGESHEGVWNEAVGVSILDHLYR